jgi:hypothetical protein
LTAPVKSVENPSKTVNHKIPHPEKKQDFLRNPPSLQKKFKIKKYYYQIFQKKIIVNQRNSKKIQLYIRIKNSVNQNFQKKKINHRQLKVKKIIK